MILAAAVSAWSMWAAPADAQSRGDRAGRPNVVLILADDMGYGDLGCYGCPDIKTPNIDGLARRGVRFTAFYANGPECTPTRAALMTGRYQHRVGGLECAIGIGNVGRYDDAARLAMAHDLGLPAGEGELVGRLKEAGYETGIVGKWHLGYEPKFLPGRHGFDHAFGPLGGAVDYFHHTEPGGEPMLYLDDRPTRREGYLTDLITEEAAAFVRHPRDRPFFLYVPYTAPHSPFQGPDDRGGRPVTVADAEQGSREAYRAMVERLDLGVGRIVRALEEAGVAGRTLLLFTSDNGGTKYARNAPYSGAKGGTFEGGIRVPCIARWPGVLPEGAESDAVAITMDLTASIVRAAGAGRARGRPFDGVDVLRSVAAREAVPPRPLFWRQRRGERTWKAARDLGLKLVVRQDGEIADEFLFDLDRDPAEKDNLLSRRPEDAERLRKLLKSWEEDVRPSR